ncbi:MAG: DUF2927 domain-containing protein [Albidovulum sp.]
MLKGSFFPVLILTALLGACVSTAPLPPPPAPPQPAPEPSAATKAGQDYYRKVEANYLAQGRMREDGGGPDTPFTTRDLVENFIAIAFYDEFTEANGALVAGGGESTLHRWQAPMRVALSFGASVPEAQRSADRAALGEFTRRLARITGHPVVLTDRNPNHTVFILNPEERTFAGALIRAAAPQTSAAAIRSVEEMRPDIYCTAFTFTTGKGAVIERAASVIRGELTPKLRALCIHEELAQSMGLINDSPRARPSIFNDNEEFALLTRQDELMLKMLYDPRLKPGMTLAEARPIVEVIAAGLMGGES